MERTILNEKIMQRPIRFPCFGTERVVSCSHHAATNDCVVAAGDINPVTVWPSQVRVHRDTLHEDVAAVEKVRMETCCVCERNASHTDVATVHVVHQPYTEEASGGAVVLAESELICWPI